MSQLTSTNQMKLSGEMGVTNFIVKNPELKDPQNYALLRETGLKYIEKLGHQLWSDYNIHDPGITLLELLCYGITDLGFRTDYNIADLLTRYENGVSYNDADFHTARDILTSRPVTFDDLRKILIDIEGVRNAWIEPHCSIQYYLNRPAKRLEDCAAEHQEEQKNDALNGLYDVFIEYEERVIRRDAFVTHGVDTPAKNIASGGFIQPAGKGILFDVHEALVLNSVVVYPDQVGSIKLRLLSEQGQIFFDQEVQLNTVSLRKKVTLNIALTAGQNYRLEAYGGSGSLKLFRTPQATYPYSIEGQIDLTSGSQAGLPVGAFLFFYDWQITYLPRQYASGITYRDVMTQAHDLLHQHRSLCQDMVNVCELKQEEIAVCTELEVSPGADLNEIMAEMFYRLEQHVSPAINFYSIDELVDRGLSMEEIFEGPLLEHGFIDDKEFAAVQRQCEIRSSDIINILMDIPHIKAVKHLHLLSFIDDVLRIQEAWQLPLAKDQGRTPSFSSEKSKVVFFRNGIPDYANRSKVAVLLNDKKAGDLSKKLKGHENDLPVPVGEHRAVGDYYLMQHEMPQTYRVGNIRVEESKSALRKAQSKQLKAFMLFFEQFLVNYLAQLDNVKSLFSWSNTDAPSYFTRAFTADDLKDIDELYINYPQLEDDLKQIIETSESAKERKSRFLDHLLGRFSENFTDYSLLMFRLSEQNQQANLDEVNQTKSCFLQTYPQTSSARGLGYDQRYPQFAADDMTPASLSGFQHRIYGLLGIKDVSARYIAGQQIEVVREQLPDKICWHFVLNDEAGQILFKSKCCDKKSLIENMIDHVLIIGADEQNYQFDPANNHYVLTSICNREGDREVIGHTIDEESLTQVIEYFARYAQSEGFHLLEHILLRKRHKTDPFMPIQVNAEQECNCSEVIDPYSYRMTLVLPAWPDRFQDIAFRQFVEDTLRREAPAHVFCKICWISHQQMQQLDSDYFAWANALANLNDHRELCREEATDLTQIPLNGQLPLPPINDSEYAQKLEALIKTMHSLVTVYPLARLKGCEELDGNDPVLVLGHSTLGSY